MFMSVAAERLTMNRADTQRWLSIWTLIWKFVDWKMFFMFDYVMRARRVLKYARRVVMFINKYDLVYVLTDL